MKELINKLEDERTVVTANFKGLHTALGTVGFPEKVGVEQFALLNKQYVGMKVYLEALDERIKLLKK